MNYDNFTTRHNINRRNILYILLRIYLTYIRYNIYYITEVFKYKLHKKNIIGRQKWI